MWLKVISTQWQHVCVRWIQRSMNCLSVKRHISPILLSLFIYDLRSFSYNSNNKGYLDENEQKMREMDTSNRGFLTNEKVYSMLEELSRCRRRLSPRGI